MTFQTSSKKNASPMMKAEFRHTMWLMAIFFVATLFALPISTLLFSQELVTTYDFSPYSFSAITRIMFDLFVRNYPLMIATFTFAVVISWNRFGYLHNSSQVDFLHALPVKRQKLFLSKLAVSNIAYLLPYLINWAVAAAIFIARGGQIEMAPAILSILFNWAFFNLFYALATLAALTTGTRVTMSIMGFLMLELIQITFFAIINLLRTFDTFVFNNWSLHSYTSALTAYMDRSIAPTWWIAAILAAILLALCSYLYRIRPSEVCGKAVWGKIFAQVIKYTTIFTAALISAMIFKEIGNSDGWLYFGAGFAIFFGHLIAEGILHFSLRNIFANWKGMIALAILIFALLASVSMDLFGYDKRYTVASDVEYYELTLEMPNLYDENIYRIASEKGKSLVDEMIVSGLSNLEQEYRTADYEYEDFYLDTKYVEIVIKPNGKSAYTRGYSEVDLKIYQKFVLEFIRTEEYKQQAKKYLEEYFTDAVSLSVSANIYDYQALDRTVNDPMLIQKIAQAYVTDFENAEIADFKSMQSVSTIEIEKSRLVDINTVDVPYTRRYRGIPVHTNYSNTIAVLRENKLPVGKVLTADDVTNIQFDMEQYKYLIEDYENMGMSREEIEKHLPPYEGIVTDKAEIQKILESYVPDNSLRSMFSIDYNFPAIATLKNGATVHLYRVVE